MTTTVTLNAIAADVVGRYGHAAKNLVKAYRAASTRALAATGTGYTKIVERAPLPLVGEQGKARLVAAERRVAGVVGQGVARTAQGYERAIDVVSGQALKGLETFARRTEWAKKMFVVDAVRRINRPFAELSLDIATRIDDATRALSVRAEGPAKKPVARRVAKKATARRARRIS